MKDTLLCIYAVLMAFFVVMGMPALAIYLVGTENPPLAVVGALVMLWWAILMDRSTRVSLPVDIGRYFP